MLQYLVVANVCIDRKRGHRSVNLGEPLSDRERREATLPDNFQGFLVLLELDMLSDDITCEKDTPLDTHVHAYLLDPAAPGVSTCVHRTYPVALHVHH